MIHRCLRAGLLLGLILLMTSCGYRFADSAPGRIQPGSSVWVAFVVNESVSSTAQTVLRRALYDEAHIMRGLQAGESYSRSDLRVSGRLTSYAIKAISYTAADRIREYGLTIDVELELYRSGETAPLWRGTLQATKEFPANSDLALQRNAEEAALLEAGHQLARRFLTTVEQGY